MVNEDTGPLSSPRRKAGRPASFTKEQALEAAVPLFWARGYDGTDLEDIAAVLGAAKPSLYRLFGCKKTLFLEALDYYAKASHASFTQLLDQHARVEKALVAAVRHAFTSGCRPGAPQGCLLACVAVAESQNHPEAGRVFASSTKALENAIAKRLERAVLEGELPNTFEPAKRARLCMDLLLASALRARVAIKPADNESLARGIISAVLA